MSLDACTFDKKEQIINFIKANKNLFTQTELNILISCISSCNNENILYTQELVREIYDELGLLPKDLNIYQEFADEIEKNYDLEGKHILELGGGLFPNLARKLSLKRRTGTITVYDPRLYAEKTIGNMTLVREKLRKTSDISSYDLIVGLMPCEGANTLIDLALKNNKDFILWLCEGGPHGDEFDFYEGPEEWIEGLISTAREGLRKNGLGQLKIKKLDERFGPYPIIYNKRNTTD